MILLLLCSFVMAIVSVVSMNVYRTSFLFENSVSVTVILAILLTMLIAGIIKILFNILAIVDKKICIVGIDTFPKNFNNLQSLFWMSFMVILIAWIPYMVAYYPGTSFGDTSTQIEMFLNYIQGKTLLQDHHPVFDTILFGGVIWMGQKFFCSSNIGCFLFIVIQCVMTAAAFSYSCVFLKRKGIRNLYCFIAVLFYALYPPIPQYAITMLKDSSYSWIYVFWFILFLEIFSENENKIPLKKKSLFFVLALFCSLTKKTGAYLLLFTAIILFFFCRKKWKIILTIFVIPALMAIVLIPTILFPLISCVPGGKQEILGILFQQTAKYVVDHGEEVTKEEREAIDVILGYDTLANRYALSVQDPVKFQNPLYTEFGIQKIDKKEFERYLKTWVNQGLKHPSTYIEATLGTCLGYFIPVNAFEIFPDAGSGLSKQIIYQPEQLSTIHYYFLEAYNRLSNTAIISLVVQVVIFSFWIPCLVIYRLLQNNREKLILMIPVAGSILLCILCPCTIGRYVMHLLYTAPLIIGIVFYKMGLKEKKVGK